MIYSAWLFGFSLFFLAAERLRPRHRVPLLRRGIWNDLFYLIFNSEYLGVLIGVASIRLIAMVDAAVDLEPLRRTVALGVMSGKPFWTQFLVLLVAYDFLQWLIHNLLHRVPWLWAFHKIHHSIEQLDWIGNWRFHWFEGVFYRALLYAPMAFFGFRGEVMFWNGVVGTFVGFFAHANLGVNVGWLRYIVNSPQMHQWHHAHPDSGPPDRNFGLTLSVWDWLFGTAWLPESDPGRLGFTGIETYPKSLWRQLLVPFWKGQRELNAAARSATSSTRQTAPAGSQHPGTGPRARRRRAAGCRSGNARCNSAVDRAAGGPASPRS